MYLIPVQRLRQIRHGIAVTVHAHRQRKPLSLNVQRYPMPIIPEALMKPMFFMWFLSNEIIIPIAGKSCHLVYFDRKIE